MPAVESPVVRWFTSSYSTAGGTNGDCVEVAMLPAATVGVRDSKDRGGPAHWVPAAAWSAFLTGVRAGEFDPACSPQA